MTLLDLTVVILVLLLLIGILFIGARAWKRGSDRAASILEIRNVQQVVRSHANYSQVNPGETVPGLRSELFGPGKYMENDPAATVTPAVLDGLGNVVTPASSSGGNHPAGLPYMYEILEENVIPEIGVLYMTVTGGADTARYMPPLYDTW